MLRGINVSGHRLIKMDALKELFVALGCTDIQTYIQSGNIVYRSNINDVNLLSNTIKNAIANQFGFDVPVITLTANELRDISEQNPFLADKQKEEAFLHVTFLSEKPDPALIASLDPQIFAPDVFKIVAKSIYLYCPNGYGNTKLSNTFFENKLKTTATTRNWKTINTLISMASQMTP
jgi:uncharacterized protein (DUF1697 family)